MKENSLDLRTILVAAQLSPTVEWRIRHGILLAVLRKPSRWLPWMRSSWLSANFSIVVQSASGQEFRYNEFKLWLRREQMASTIKILNEICSSNSGATRYFEHPNPNIRKLAYIKQTDFRDIPILFMIDNGKTEKPVPVNGAGSSPNVGGASVPRVAGELPRPAFLTP